MGLSLSLFARVDTANVYDTTWTSVNQHPPAPEWFKFTTPGTGLHEYSQVSTNNRPAMLELYNLAGRLIFKSNCLTTTHGDIKRLVASSAKVNSGYYLAKFYQGNHHFLKRILL